LEKDPAQLRISDADRHQVAEVLRQAAGVTIDLREAHFAAREVVLTANALMGSVNVTRRGPSRSLRNRLGLPEK